MSETVTIEGLLKNLEEATGPVDPGTVARIFAAARGTYVKNFGIGCGDGGEDEMHIVFADGTRANFSEYDWPDRSLDAAMSLVPNGMEIEMNNLYGLAMAAVGINLDSGPYYATHKSGNLILALCMAAIKACCGDRHGE